jgi:hypothetical protein
MSCRTIPIQPERPAQRIEAPRLSGDPATVQRVVGALQTALDEHVGLREPTGAWLRELRLAGDEAELSLAPGLPCCGSILAQAAFETLRALLPDTDIYVRTAAH